VVYKEYYNFGIPIDVPRCCLRQTIILMFLTICYISHVSKMNITTCHIDISTLMIIIYQNAAGSLTY